jgi:Spx/MgsR family transcriptional regulator
MIRLYGVPSCQQIKKSIELFREINIPFEFINLRKDPLSAARIEALIVRFGMETVLNSKGLTYRKLGLSTELGHHELLQWLIREQSLIKRPLIERDGQFWIHKDGFNRERILLFIK